MAQAAPGARPPRTAPQPAPDRRPANQNAERRQQVPAADPDPWLQVHFGELDQDRDGTVTRAEIDAEVQRTFDGYDVAKAGRVAIAALNVRVQTALAGFVKEHADEVDRDGDKFLTRAEINAALVQMFNRADGNRDGRTDPAEIAAGTNGGQRRGQPAPAVR